MEKINEDKSEKLTVDIRVCKWDVSSQVINIYELLITQ